MSEITERQLNAKPPSKVVWLTESAPKGHGRFMSRLTPSGEKLFYFRYTNSSNKCIFLPLGSYCKSGISGLTLKDARQKARELTNLYIEGVKDIEEYLTAKNRSEMLKITQENLEQENKLQKLSDRKTTKDIFEYWHKIEISKRKDAGKEVRRIFEKDVLPYIGDMPIEEVKRSHVMDVIDILKSRNLTHQPKRVFSLIRQMFLFALERERIDIDPTASIRKKKIGAEEQERDRVLSPDELLELKQVLVSKTASFQRAKPNERFTMTRPLKEEYQLAIWISLSTLCRVGELSLSKWESVNFENKTWLIEAVLSKNGKEHLIYLSDFALYFFKQLYQLTGHTEWFFPSGKKTEQSIGRKVITKQITDRQVQFTDRDVSKMAGRANNNDLVLSNGKNGNWVFHDLRRTGATIMQSLKIPLEVIDGCQNHVIHKGEKQSVRRAYLHYDYDRDKQEAWDKLGEYLNKLI